LRILHDHFAIDGRAIGTNLSRRSHDAPIDQGPVMSIARKGMSIAVPLGEQGAIAVIFDLVFPIVAMGRLIDQGRQKRGNEEPVPRAAPLAISGKDRIVQHDYRAPAQSVVFQ
jgi:hypothetical protein